MFGDWKSLIPIVTSVVTAGVAILAVMLTFKQIKLSNKQHLFDKRIENYIIIKGLIQLFRSNCSLISDEEDKPMLTIDLDFIWMTNNSYLEGVAPAIQNPLNEPSQKQLLIKLESLKEVATKIRFLFSDDVSILMEEFVLCYQELLFEMYKYKIIVDKIMKENENHELTLEEISKKVGEKKYRDKLIKAFDSLKQADSMLKKENVEVKIEKQIRLC